MLFQFGILCKRSMNVIPSARQPWTRMRSDGITKEVREMSSNFSFLFLMCWKCWMLNLFMTLFAYNSNTQPVVRTCGLNKSSWRRQFKALFQTHIRIVFGFQIWCLLNYYMYVFSWVSQATSIDFALFNGMRNSYIAHWRFIVVCWVNETQNSFILRGNFDILLRYADEPKEKKKRKKKNEISAVILVYEKNVKHTHTTIAILSVHLLFTWQKGSIW